MILLTSPGKIRCAGILKEALQEILLPLCLLRHVRGNPSNRFLSNIYIQYQQLEQVSRNGQPQAMDLSHRPWSITPYFWHWWYQIELVTGESPCSFRSGLLVCHILQILCWPVTNGPEIETAIAHGLYHQNFKQ